MLNHGVTFNLGSARVCSPAIFETDFSCNKDISIAVTDYYVYLIVLFLFAVTLQLIIFYSHNF